MLEEENDTYVIEREVIPFLKTYLIENTVKINYKKLINATQYIPISLLAWLQAVTENQTSDFHSIDWLNHNHIIKQFKVVFPVVFYIVHCRVSLLNKRLMTISWI